MSQVSRVYQEKAKALRSVNNYGSTIVIMAPFQQDISAARCGYGDTLPYTLLPILKDKVYARGPDKIRLANGTELRAVGIDILPYWVGEGLVKQFGDRGLVKFEALTNFDEGLTAEEAIARLAEIEEMLYPESLQLDRPVVNGVPMHDRVEAHLNAMAEVFSPGTTEGACIQDALRSNANARECKRDHLRGVQNDMARGGRTTLSRLENRWRMETGDQISDKMTLIGTLPSDAEFLGKRDASNDIAELAKAIRAGQRDTEPVDVDAIRADAEQQAMERMLGLFEAKGIDIKALLAGEAAEQKRGPGRPPKARADEAKAD